MPNRLLFGERTTGVGDFGLYISKPFTDVLTVNPFDLLLDTNRTSIQYCTSGVVLLQSSVYTSITVPDLGYKPFLIGFQNVKPELYPKSTVLNWYGPTSFRVPNNTTIEFIWSSGYPSITSSTYSYMVIGGITHT